MNKNPEICGFCGNNSKTVGLLVEGNGLGNEDSVYICSKCVETCREILNNNPDQPNDKCLDSKQLVSIPTPREIYEHLDSHVIGQKLAKKKLSVEVNSHFHRLIDSQLIEVSNKPKSNLLNNPSLKDVRIEKSNICLIGPSGSGKTLLAKSLAEKLNVPFAIGDATTITEAGYVGEDVENLLLKLLSAADFDVEAAERGIIFIDEIDKLRKTGGNLSITRDVSGEGVQQSLLKMIEGTIANVPPQGGRKHPEQQFIEIDTTNILFIVGGAFVGLDDVVKKRLNKRSIGFNSLNESNDAKDPKFKNELLAQVTSDDLIEYGMIPEFVGRLPVVAALQELSLDEMIQILTVPKNALLRQEQKKMAFRNIELTFTEDAIVEIAEQAMKSGTGARALRNIVADFMTDIYFNLGKDDRIKKLVIDKQMIKKNQKGIRIINEAA